MPVPTTWSPRWTWSISRSTSIGWTTRRPACRRARGADDDPEHEVYLLHALIEIETRRERWRRALDLAVEATRVDRLGRTTDVLAFVVAQVFGEPDRPAPPAEEVERALAASRRRASETASGGPWHLKPSAPPTPAHRRPVDEVSQLRRLRLPQAPQAQHRRLPGVQPPLPPRRWRRGSSCCSTRAASRI